MSQQSREARGLGEMLDALPELVVRFRLPDLTILYCNASWAAWYSSEPAQVIGRPLDQFLSADGLAGLTAQLTPSALTIRSGDEAIRQAPNSPGQWIEWVDRYLSGPDGAEILAVGATFTIRHLAEPSLPRVRPASAIRRQVS